MNADDSIESQDNPPPKRWKDVNDRKQEPIKQKVPKFFEMPEQKRTIIPSGKFSSFTPLNTPIDQLLMQIQDDPSLRWPRKIRSNPNSRAKNLYCWFHRDHGHLIENCMALKEQVETLIDRENYIRMLVVHQILVHQRFKGQKNRPRITGLGSSTRLVPS